MPSNVGADPDPGLNRIIFPDVTKAFEKAGSLMEFFEGEYFCCLRDPLASVKVRALSECFLYYMTFCRKGMNKMDYLHQKKNKNKIISIHTFPTFLNLNAVHTQYLIMRTYDCTSLNIRNILLRLWRCGWNGK